MVNILSDTNKNAVAQAIAEAEKMTSAELVVVVTPASDAYQSYLLLYGLLTASTLDMGLWATKTVTGFPLLLIIQLIIMTLFCFIPWLRRLLIWLVPKHIRHHRAAHRAYEEYLFASRHVSAATPIVLLYVSLAEHYAHILTSRSVREKIPNEHWNAIIGELTCSISSDGVQNTCIKALRHITDLLVPHFPENTV